MSGPGIPLRRLIGSRAGRLELKRRLGARLWPAVAYLARFYRRTLARRPLIVAVIGSTGKTTTMRAVSAVLDLPVSRRALLNMNSHDAIGRAMFSIRPWQARAVLEVAITSPGQMRVQAATVRPNVVVVTSIGRDHSRSLGSLEGTRGEKVEIVRALRRSHTAVLNADDPNVRWMAGQTRARVVLVGEAADAHVRASDIELDWPHGMRFAAHIGSSSWPVRTRLLGRKMVYPALAAIAVAHIEGLPVERAIGALATFEPTIGRMQMSVLPSGAVVIRDEFKATIDSWEAALDAFADVPARRRLLVVGDVEEVSGREDYRHIGRRAGAFVDRMIVVGPGKLHQAYRTGAMSAGMDRERIDHVHSASQALELLRDELSDGDAVLLKARWQQALGRIALALAGREVRCRADPCPFKRMLCDICPMLDQPFHGLAGPAANEAN
jgi:UDP-N-acetylmuramoyl-tripeptide--D-alanyl-D-alanine ligase